MYFLWKLRLIMWKVFILTDLYKNVQYFVCNSHSATMHVFCSTHTPLYSVLFFCLILTCDTWKYPRIPCRFQIWTQKYQIPDSKNLHFLTYANLCKLGDYVDNTINPACGTSREPNLPSIILISSVAQILWKITSSAVKVIWDDSIMSHLGHPMHIQDGTFMSNCTSALL